MDEPPRADQPPSEFTLRELHSERDINVAHQQVINYFAAAVGDIAQEAQARSRTSAFFAELPVVAERQDDGLARARVAELAALVAARRLLILHPQPDVPAALLARSIGAIARHGDPAHPLTVLEFLGLPGDDRRFDLVEEIQRFAEPCLFLVLEASREVLGWHLDQLCEVVGRQRHQLVAVAETSEGAWRLTPSERVYWHEASAVGLFDRDALATLLREGLDAEAAPLQGALAEEWRTHGTLGGREPGALAQSLGTPLKVRSFLQGLRGLPPGAAAAAVDALLGQIARQQLAGSLRRWFFQQLGRRDQLIALGGSLFTGLREDLFYAQVQRLLVEAWGLREFEGRLLDYVDLEPAEAFFAFNEVEPGRVQVESRYGDLRPNLLALAVTDYQRHVRQAVTWMANVLRQSMQRGVSRQEGLEQYEQRAEVRRVIGEALSDIGLLRLSLVEHAVLALVGDQRAELPVHAARVFARWYELGHIEPFATLLQRWSTAREPVEVVRAWLVRTGDAERTDPADALRAGLLLICGYAARFDPPDAIAPLLMDQIAPSTGALGPRVRRAWRSAALANLIPLHLNQLAPLLRQLVVYEDLRGVVAEQLATAYAGPRRKDVRALIASWLQEAREQDQGPAAEPSGQVEAQLLTLTRMLERLPYGGEDGAAMLQTAQRLLRIIEELPCPQSVHDAIRTTRCRLGRHDPALLGDLLTTLPPAEVPLVAEVLLQVYLDERAAQPAGDLTLEHGGRSIPIRLDGRRPLTTTERMVKQWLLTEGSATQRQLALHIGIAQVRALDRREQAFIAEQQLAAQADGTTSAITLPGDAGVADRQGRPDFFRDQFVPTLVTLDAPYLRSAVVDLLPEARRLRDPTRGDLAFLLEEKWPLQGRALDDLARRLGEGLALCERGWAGVGFRRYPAALYALLLLVLSGSAPLLLLVGVAALLLLALSLLVGALR